jgi:hypothetical protein
MKNLLGQPLQSGLFAWSQRCSNNNHAGSRKACANLALEMAKRCVGVKSASELMASAPAE